MSGEMTFPDLTCPHCGQLVKLVPQNDRAAFAEPQKAAKPAPPPPPPWKEPMKVFTEALNAGIREIVAESGRITLEAIRALPRPAAPVVHYTAPPIELPPPPEINYTPPPITYTPPEINYTPPPLPPLPPAVVQISDPPPAPPSLTAEDVAAVARREATASTQQAVGALAPILDKLMDLASRPAVDPPAQPPVGDAEFDVQQRADGTTRITKRTAAGVTEFLVEPTIGGNMRITRKQG